MTYDEYLNAATRIIADTIIRDGFSGIRGALFIVDNLRTQVTTDMDADTDADTGKKRKRK